MGRDTTGRTRKTDSLDGFKLWFEDLPPKAKVKKTSKVFSKPVEQPSVSHNKLGFSFISIKRFISKSSEGIYMGVPRTSRTTVKNNVKVNKKITSVKDGKRVRFSKILLPFRKFSLIMDIVVRKAKALITTIFTKLKKLKGTGMPKSKNNNEATVEKTVAKPNKSVKRGLGSGILGLYMATVIASIAFSTVFILIGTENKAWYYLVAPQASFAVGVLAIAFWKLAKNW